MTASSAPALLTVNPAVKLTIVVQPLNQVLNYGGGVNLSVQVTGSSPITYQWKKDGVALPYSQSSSFQIYGATPADNGTYTVVITNPAGSVTSADAVVSVNPAVVPVIAVQPVSQTLAYYGQLTLNVQVTGSNPFSYQWRKDGIALSGATNSTLPFRNATPADNGIYTVVVTNPAGSATSSGAVVTVNPAVAPAIVKQPTSQTASYFGSVSLSVQVTGSAPLSYFWKKDGVPLNISFSSSLNLLNATPADNGTYSVIVSNSVGSVISDGALVTISPAIAPVISFQPDSQTVDYFESIFLHPRASGSDPLTFQWMKDGVVLPGASNRTLSIDHASPANSGVYTLVIANPAGIVTSNPAIVSVSTTNKVAGSGTEISANIPHPNGNVFDQVLLSGAAESITADVNQVTRTSFIDLNDDIVQVEFAGVGTLSLVLDNPTGPATPLNYNQPSVAYMKGHVGIVIAGANETTNVSIFTVGRVTAFDPTGAFDFLQPAGPTNNPANNGSTLFQGHATTAYDGIADIAFIAISSTNSKFGGLRASDASCFATKGYTGIYAPGVQFTGPVFIGDIDAHDSAVPMFIVGSASDTRIAGGDLSQSNNQPVKVSGLSQLKFVPGSTSHGTTLPAQTNKARLEQNGVEVTAQIVVNPGP